MIIPSDLGLPLKFKKFRSYPGFSQWDTAVGISSAEYRFSGLQAPPGCGKTTINIAASRLLDSSRTLYLTVNKPLQNQLMNDFADSEINLFNLIGHSAYPCANRRVDDSGDISEIECSEGRDSCPYWQDVEKSLSRTHVSSNIANWVTIAKIGDKDRFGKFDLLILDEAHNLEKLLCDLLAIKFSRRGVYELIECNMPKIDESVRVWIEWARVCHLVCVRHIAESRRIDALDRVKSTLTKRLERLAKNLLTVAEIDDDWIVESTSTGAQLTPVFADRYAEEYLFRGIPRVILSSATLTRKDFEYLGIDNDNSHLIEIESGFDAARRPFYYWPTTKVDRDMVEGQIIKVVNRMDRYYDSRQALGWKGLIHTVSYEHAKTISKFSKHNIITHIPRDKQRAIDNFMSRTDPCILASPVISEGMDFSGDAARCQFIWKVPTKYSKDPLIAARKKRDPKYPYYLAAKDMLQMTGRICRSMTDYGETVIFDCHWGNWMISAVPWPKYFRSSWRTIKEIPPPLKF